MLYIRRESNVCQLLVRSPIFILLFILLACNKYSRLEPSQLLVGLKEQEKTVRTYYLYPSILRIINLQDNPDFNELIRHVEKTIVYRLKPQLTGEEIFQLKWSLQEEEHFEEYAQISIKGQKSYFLGKENPDHSIIIFPLDGEYFVTDILGQINFLEINNLIQSLSAQDTSEQDQFLDIFQIMGINNSPGNNQNDIDSNTVIIPEEEDLDTILNNNR